MTARFVYMKLHKTYPDDCLLIADEKTEVLTLLRGTSIVAQRNLHLQSFPTKRRFNPYSGVGLIKLFWRYYPDFVRNEVVDEWLVEVAPERRITDKIHTRSKVMGRIRKCLQPFGLTIVTKANIGYVLKPLDFVPSRSPQFEVLSLPGILDSSMTLTLNHTAEGKGARNYHILTLSRGHALLEQALLLPVAYPLFQLFLKSEEFSISHVELIMLIHGANERQARKWLRDTADDKQAHYELMRNCYTVVTRLRMCLLQFGIQIYGTPNYGYELGRDVRTVQERAKRSV